MIVTVFVSDRGDQYLPRCIDTFDTYVYGESDRIVVDDRDHRFGMAGAVRDGWTRALDLGADYVFHVEEDFEFRSPVQLDSLQYILDRAPHLAQVVLKRQPWNEQEKQAGGIVEQEPDAYVECGAMGRNVRWTEHRRIFSLNPCLIPRRTLELGWPDGNEAEFTQRCLDAEMLFAFYGGRFDPPVVHHVGYQRSGGWRL